MVRSMCLLTVALAAASLVSQASAPPADAVKVRVPQSFRAGEAWLPAGNYSIRPVMSLSALPVLVIQSESGDSVLVPASSTYDPAANSASTPRLVFHRAGGKLILTTIWPGDGDRGFEVIGAPRPQAPAAVDSSKQATD